MHKGRPVCILWLSADYIASTASILNLLALSIDRYMAITSPLQSLSVRTKSFALTMIALAWLISSLWLLPITLWHYIFPDDELSSLPTSHAANDPHHQQLQHLSQHYLSPNHPSSFFAAHQPSSTRSPANNSNEPHHLAYHYNTSSLNLSLPQNLVASAVAAASGAHCTPPYDKSIVFKITTCIFNFYLPLFALIAINARIYWTIYKSSRGATDSAINTTTTTTNNKNNTGNNDGGGGGPGHIKIRRIYRNNKQEKAFRYFQVSFISYIF